MISSPYKVYAVVDREFGEKLAALAIETPVWIVDTPANKPVAQRLWKERDTNNHLTGVTTFNDAAASSPEDILIARLEDIDMHHGIYSATPPYTILVVIGTPLSERLEREMSAYGFNDFRQTADGFIATRPEPPNPR